MRSLWSDTAIRKMEHRAMRDESQKREYVKPATKKHEAQAVVRYTSRNPKPEGPSGAPTLYTECSLYYFY